MISAEIKISLQKALLKEGFAKRASEVLETTAEDVIVPLYKKEVPANKATARSDTKVTKTGAFQFVVGSNTTNKGFRYLLAVHGGTGKYEGNPADFGHPQPGRVRASGTYNERYQKMFGAMVKRGWRPSIKPDKFADRAREAATPKANTYILSQIRKFLGE